jgi:hypothetical protein
MAAVQNAIGCKHLDGCVRITADITVSTAIPAKERSKKSKPGFEKDCCGAT